MEMLNVKVNGIAVSVPKGATILEAARAAGVEIPTLCYLKEINEIGACRICVVEVKGQKNLPAACVTPVYEGMEILTNSERVFHARKMNLELILSTHKKECLSCMRSGNCELQKMCKDFRVDDENYYAGENMNWTVDDTSVHMIRDNNKCILCRRCVAACEAFQSVGVIGANNRGFDTVIGTAMDGNLAETSCVNCGQCIVACPMRLQPLYMYRFVNAGRVDQLQRLHIMDCMECGSCAFTCPGKLPLVERFRKGKQMVREAQTK